MGISFPVRGSTARAACSRETTPSRLGSLSSANMTGVWNCSPSSLIVVSQTSTGSILPSAVSDGRILSTGTPRRWSICLGTAVGILHVVATKKGGVIPSFWSLGPFFVAEVKSLGCLGKQV